MSPIASKAHPHPSVGFGPGHTSPQFSEGGKTLRGGHATPDDSFIRHDTYFFKDGNVTFLVDGTLYCVHRYFFSRDSVYFSTRFTRLGVCDHEAFPTIISIGDVERKDFEALLSVLYPANFEGHEPTYEQWKSILHLSTCWGFASLRKLALKSINPPTSHDQFVLARTYSIDHWVLPALTALCERTLPLSLGEARQMKMEDVILVATVREEIRGGALRVDAVDIPRHVAKVQQANLEAKADPEARAEAEASAKETGEKAKLETEAKAKAEAEAKLKSEAKAKRKDEANKEAKAKREASAKAGAGAKEKREADIKIKAEADARKKPEAESKEKREAEIKAKAESDGSSAQHSSTTSFNPHGSAFTHPATSIRAAPSPASVVSSSPTLVSQGRKPIDDRQDGKRPYRTLIDRLLGNTRDRKGDQVTVALPTGAAAVVPDEAKSGAAAATANTRVPSSTTDTSDDSQAPGGATAPDSLGNKSADFAPASSEAESTQAQRTAPEEFVTSSEPNQGPVHMSTATAAPADGMPAPPVPEKGSTPEQDTLVIKGRAPSAEPVALVPSRPNDEPEAPTAPDADAKKTSETPAQTESPRPTQGNGEKSDGAATKAALQPSQNGEVGGVKPTTKGDDARPEGLVKPALHLDHFHEANTTFTTFPSDPRTPVAEAPLSSLEKEDGLEDDGEPLGVKSSRNQRKRLREKARKEKAKERARKQVQGDETNTPHPPSGEPPNGVDNSFIQEPRPVVTAPVDISVWGQGVLVDVKTESGEDDALLIVERPDAAVTPAEMVVDSDAEWGW